MDDPWDWDVDRIVQELCSADQTRNSSKPLKLLPVDQLEAALRENEVDGEVLLTYDQSELCADLGLKILKHKSVFKNAIRDIQLRSPQYRIYRKRRASEFEDDGEELNQDWRLNKAKPQGVTEARALGPSGNSPDDVPSSDLPAIEAIPLSRTLFPIARDGKTPKRRVAPTLVDTGVGSSRGGAAAAGAGVSLPVGEFAVEHTEKLPNGVPARLLPGAYLGDEVVSGFGILDHDRDGLSDSSLDNSKHIHLVSTSSKTLGRVIQVHRSMKRFLLGGNSHGRTRAVKADVVPVSTIPEHDEVLPLYGDSDDDMEFDSDTWREIEAEEVERDKKQSRTTGLSADEIDSTIDRMLKQLASEWNEKKLPKYASQAHRIWKKGRGPGLKYVINKAQDDLRRLEARIAKLREGVQENEYRNVGELEQFSSFFERSVFDREHCSWLIGILTSPLEPAKMSAPRKRAELPPQPRPVTTDGEDEEVLTSDSEDDMNDFIDGDSDAVMADIEFPVTDETNHVARSSELLDTGMDIDRDDTAAEVDHGQSREENSSLPDAKGDPVQISSSLLSQQHPQTPTKPIQSNRVDLTTSTSPTRRTMRYKNGKMSSQATPSRSKENATSSPLIMGINDLTSVERRIANELVALDQMFINSIFSIACCHQPEDIWIDLILVAFDREWPKAPYITNGGKDGLTAYTMVRLFETYRDDVTYKLSRYKNMNNEGKQRLRELYTLYPGGWNDFIGFLKRLSDRFEWTSTKPLKLTSSTPSRVARDEKTLSDDTGANTDLNTDDEEAASGEEKEKGKKKKKKKKRKEVVRDREAARVREQVQAAAVEQASRRKVLRERLINEGSTALGSQDGSIIINESKKDDQEFIYIHHDIARRIKEHQITGVRFMWDQVVAATKRQGCLLAHTMGLGKTMQVITLLVTIGQASQSENPKISSQIPDEIRDSKTLILCPATLVNNWVDEMLSWLPENHGLGEIFKIDAILSVEQRNQAVQSWNTVGGIMIIGYNLFKTFTEDVNMRDIFLEGPNIIIADEAHLMKNPTSKTHVAAANFRALSRVALTGSPLANNVEEYYSMINWVAPNYLGDIREFRAQYANPIKEGLHVDSTASDRRRALRILRVLKSEVSPKVNRITLAVLKHDIPVKKEFVITVPLTPIQRQAYELFIQYHSTTDPEATKVPVFAIHDLSLICASPSIFLEKLEEAKKGKKPTDKSATVTLPQPLISAETTLLRNAERGVNDHFTQSWKVAMLFEILDQCKKVGDYVLLFSHSMVTLNYLEGQLRLKKRSFVRLDGKTQMAERQNMVKRFNKGNFDIFLISTKAGALGLNITGANRVIVFDAQFNPQNEQQAVGRAYRIGQEKPVVVYRFVCGGTCEETLLHQAVWKMQLASRVVDKKHPIPKAPRSTSTWDMPGEAKQKDLDSVLGKDNVLDTLLQNDKYRKGIRAVEMMDVFEEEAVENAELSPEDVAIADQIIKENEARRSGRPLPLQTMSNGMNMSTAYGQGSSFTGMMSTPQFIPQTTVGTSFLPTPQGMGNTHTLSAPLQTTWTKDVPTVDPKPMDHPVLMPPSGPTFHDPGSRDRDSRPPQILLPMQLPGAEVHVRPDTTSSSALGFFSDLKRAFAVNSGFPDPATREEAARSISDAVWNKIKHLKAGESQAMRWAIMNALNSERFVQGLCLELISPQKLAEMVPEDVDKLLKTWRAIDQSEWEAKKESWISRRRPGDPEHLQNALTRLSIPTSQAAYERQIDQNKSYRLDDHEALQAVFERRRLKTQKQDDHEVLRVVEERRKAKDSPSQSSGSGRESRLPGWAMNVARQAQIPAPSSSASLESPSSPNPSLRPPPRTPFK
ncbi:hypothetical protein F4777DRAFT_311572 [Nemania sp. FL0916]|nr:hypothetical protein F4777DRAFT_311572 [Nemania sp. FL0916]